MKKKLIFLLKLLAVIIIALNFIILLSGRFYLYKGIWNTYLKGRTGPGIYDLTIFANAKVEKAAEPFNFAVVPNSYTLTAEEKAFFDRLGTRSFLMIENDSIIFESYFNGHTDTTHSNSFSAAKTVIGLLIGCALDEGKIKSIDEPVAEYIPEFKSGGKEIITIRHLITMSSGLDWEESGKNPFSENAESYYGNDLYRLVTHQKRITEPGKVFNYQSGNSQLLGFILEKATGKSVSQYASEKIWSKIGTKSDAYWSLDKKDGDEKAFCCLYATTRDFAKLGRLILNRGKWNEETVVSEKYMADFLNLAPLSTLEEIPNTRYGYHIWLYPEENHPVYYCRGILGQYVISIPSKNRIIIRTGMKRDPNMTIEDAKNDLLKVGHPKDFFEYLKIAERISQKK